MNTINLHNPPVQRVTQSAQANRSQPSPAGKTEPIESPNDRLAQRQTLDPKHAIERLAPDSQIREQRTRVYEQQLSHPIRVFTEVAEYQAQPNIIDTYV